MNKYEMDAVVDALRCIRNNLLSGCYLTESSMEYLTIIDDVLCADSAMAETFFVDKYGADYQDIIHGLWKKRVNSSNKYGNMNVVFGYIYMSNYQLLHEREKFNIRLNYETNAPISYKQLAGLLCQSIEAYDYHEDTAYVFQHVIIPMIVKTMDTFEYEGIQGHFINQVITQYNENIADEIVAREHLVSMHRKHQAENEGYLLTADDIIKTVVYSYFQEHHVDVNVFKKIDFANNRYLVEVKPKDGVDCQVILRCLLSNIENDLGVEKITKVFCHEKIDTIILSFSNLEKIL